MFTGTQSRLLLIGLILLAVGAVALGWFLGVDPQLKALDRAKQETTQEKMLNDAEQIAVGNLKVQNDSIDELRKELEDFQLGIPQTDRESRMLRLIRTASSGSGATVTGIETSELGTYLPPEWQQPAPNTGQGRLVALSVVIQAEGSVSQLQGFVSRVQRLDRYITVDSVAYSDGKAGTKVKITGVAWVLLSPEAAAAAAAADGNVEPDAPAEGEEGAAEEAEAADAAAG